MIDEPLSEHGTARRSQILQLAQGEARRRRQRRLAGRGSVTLVIFAVALSVPFLRHLQSTPTPVPQPTPIARATPAPVSAPPLAQYVQTDPTITDRLTLKPEAPKWTPIDDHELLTQLAAAGQPAGIVSVHGKTMLLMR